MNLAKRFRRYLKQRRLRRKRIPWSLWHQVVAQTPVLSKLNKRELHRLRILASLFLLRKTINGAGSWMVDDFMRVTIAAQACLLILNLDLDYFDGWVEIIVYPEPFIAEHKVVDENGVVTQQRHTLGGESWSRGPIILSWSDIAQDSRQQGGIRNVVLHEFSHKLDTLNGPADGLPPLHKEVRLKRWSHDFNEVYDTLQRQVAYHQHTALNPYASVSPAEFFAVVTEYFFEAPDLLYRHYPNIYRDLQGFYRQNALDRHAFGHSQEKR